MYKQGSVSNYLNVVFHNFLEGPIYWSHQKSLCVTYSQNSNEPLVDYGMVSHYGMSYIPFWYSIPGSIRDLILFQFQDIVYFSDICLKKIPYE